MNNRNGFDLLRLLAALMVTFSHCYPLLRGGDQTEPLFAATGLLTLSHSGLVIFFAISGYLITQSWESKKNLLHYWTNRVLRIYPGILINGVIVLLVLYPVFAYPPVGLHDLAGIGKDFLKYTLTFSTLHDNHYNVFAAMPFKEINGSLWTLRYELGCYLLLPAIALLHGLFKSRYTIFIIYALVVVLYLMALLDFIGLPQSTFVQGFTIGKLLLFLAYFLSGACIRLMQLKLNHILLIAAALPLLSLLPGFNAITGTLLYLSLAWVAVAAGLFAKPIAGRFKYDLSYGIYIYSFPVQQLIIFNFPGLTPLLLFAYTLPAVLLLAFFSYARIERRALQFKKRLFPAPLADKA